MDDNLEKKLGTRVFKKSSPNNKLTIYLGKRDFLDNNGTVDPIDGVVLIDKEYVKDRRVFGEVLAAFYYGREDLDVLGLTFRQDLYVSSHQLYPPLEENVEELTVLQDRLIKKLGDSALPFYFQMPHLTPASVTLQPSVEDTSKPCGVTYELKVYVTENGENRSHTRSSVKLLIRKLSYASSDPGPQPSQEIVKEFKMCNGRIRLEATLDKAKYFHGESIAVNVTIDNTSNRPIKKIRLQVNQISDIMLFSRAIYKCVVDEIESDDSFPIPPGQIGWCKVFYMCPLLSNNRDKTGLALDGKIRYEDTNLASTTILYDNMDEENMGIIVSYNVRVRLILGFGTSDLTLEVPFLLTHPNPTVNVNAEKTESSVIKSKLPQNILNSNTYFDTIEDNQDDEFVFEDFARLRLLGIDNACEEA